MTWPASDVSTTNTTSAVTAGQPAAFRADANDLITKFNQLRNHVASFAQTLLTRTTAALARTDLQLGTHYFAMDSSAGRTSSGNFSSFTDTASQSAGGGNSGAAGTYTAPLAGMYSFTATMLCTGTFAGAVGNKYVLGYLTVNGTAIGVGGAVPYTVVSQDANTYASFSVTIKLAASDVVRVACDHAASGITAQCTRFTGVFVG